MVHIPLAVLAELQINRKDGGRIADMRDAMTIDWSDEVAVYQLQGVGWMDTADNEICRKAFAIIGNHSCCLRFVTFYFDGFFPCQHLATHRSYRSCQRVGHLTTTSDDAESTLIIRVDNQGMCRKGGMVFFSSIE